MSMARRCRIVGDHARSNPVVAPACQLSASWRLRGSPPSPSAVGQHRSQATELVNQARVRASRVDRSVERGAVGGERHEIERCGGGERVEQPRGIGDRQRRVSGRDGVVGDDREPGWSARGGSTATARSASGPRSATLVLPYGRTCGRTSADRVSSTCSTMAARTPL
jgi:hypothetical protein